MDAFKQNEILRMQYGGNKTWQDFFTRESRTNFDSASIKERYDCEVGEEYKERLTAKVEDREFDKAAFTKERAVMLQKQAERAATPMGGLGSNGNSRSASPAKPSLPAGQKARNENFFAKMGQANASRPENLAPSQGGKYAGFGSAPPEPQDTQHSALPSADEFSKDPVAALTKGFGWFSTAVAKQAKVVNDSYIQPTAKQVSRQRSLFYIL
jgi:ADP-ribosylation factor GTPase-activating protein 1